MICTYIVNIMDDSIQEPINIIANGDVALKLIISRKPEHHLILNVQNLGPTVEADDYLKKLTDDGDLNFGHGGHT